MTERWQPHRPTSINDYDVEVVKLQGQFVRHTHSETDELCMVVGGQVTINFAIATLCSTQATCSRCRVALNTAQTPPRTFTRGCSNPERQGQIPAPLAATRRLCCRELA